MACAAWLSWSTAAPPTPTHSPHPHMRWAGPRSPWWGSGRERRESPETSALVVVERQQRAKSAAPRNRTARAHVPTTRRRARGLLAAALSCAQRSLSRPPLPRASAPSAFPARGQPQGRSWRARGGQQVMRSREARTPALTHTCPRPRPAAAALRRPMIAIPCFCLFQIFEILPANLKCFLA